MTGASTDVVEQLLTAGADPRNVRGTEKSVAVSRLIEEAIRLRERGGEQVLVSGAKSQLEANGCRGILSAKWVGRGRCCVHLADGRTVELKQTAVQPAPGYGVGREHGDVDDCGDSGIKGGGDSGGDNTGSREGVGGEGVSERAGDEGDIGEGGGNCHAHPTTTTTIDAVGIDPRDEQGSEDAPLLHMLKRCINSQEEVWEGGESPLYNSTRTSIADCALVNACLEGDSAKMLSCLEEGASIESIFDEERGIHALHAAILAQTGTELNCVKLLLDSKACPNHATGYGETPAKLCIDYHLPHVLRILMQAGAKIGELEMGAAALSKSPNCLCVLLEAGVSTDMRVFKMTDAPAVSPLAVAALAGRTANVAHLLKAGASIELQTSQDASVSIFDMIVNIYHQLINNETKPLVSNIGPPAELKESLQLLLQADMRLKQPEESEERVKANEKYHDSLLEACAQGSVEVVELLLGAGMDPNVYSSTKLTCLIQGKRKGASQEGLKGSGTVASIGNTHLYASFNTRIHSPNPAGRFTCSHHTPPHFITSLCLDPSSRSTHAFTRGLACPQHATAAAPRLFVCCSRRVQTRRTPA
jgi:ankyrin repeat protein